MRATSECRWLTMPAMVTRELRAELAACWREVANAGGAVGFPFPPVSDDQVRAALCRVQFKVATGPVCTQGSAR